jgi:hypothetical protein
MQDGPAVQREPVDAKSPHHAIGEAPLVKLTPGIVLRTDLAFDQCSPRARRSAGFVHIGPVIDDAIRQILQLHQAQAREVRRRWFGASREWWRVHRDRAAS